MTRLWYGAVGIGLALALTVGAAGADDKKDDKKSDPPPGGARGRVAENLSAQLVPADVRDKLKLTDAQKEKVGKLEKEFEDKVKEKLGTLREDLQKARQNQDREALRGLAPKLREAMQDAQGLLEDYEGKVKAVLSDEQKKLYETAIKDRPRGLGGVLGGGLPGAGGILGRGPQQPKELTSPAVQEQLNLTPEQKAKHPLRLSCDRRRVAQACGERRHVSGPEAQRGSVR